MPSSPEDPAGSPRKRHFLLTHIRPKVIFFFCFLAGCASFPYVPLIYSEVLKLTKDQIGIITSLTPFIGAVSAPLGTWIVDVTHRRLLVIIVTGILASASQWAFTIPGLSFTGACLVAAVQSFLGAPFFPLIDALVLDLLGDDKEAYGQQRLFAAISCGISYVMTSGLVILSGQLFAAFANQSFWTVIFLIVLVIATQSSPSKRTGSGQHEVEDGESHDGQQEHRDSIESDFDDGNPSRHLLSGSDSDARGEEVIISTGNGESDDTAIALPQRASNSYGWIFRKDFIIFQISMAILGTSFAIVQGFLWIFLVEHLGASRLLLGFTGPFSIAVELPFFFYSKQILEKIGMQNSILLGHGAMAIRLLCYTLLPSGDGAWLVLGVELLHGFSFSLMWTAAVKLASEMAPSSFASLAQGLLNSSHFGVGFGCGAIVAGRVYQTYGAIVMFRGGSAALVFSMLLFWIVNPQPLPKKVDVVIDNEELI